MAHIETAKKMIGSHRHGSATAYPFFEFFAGGGMARLGLGEAWSCSFANDICPKKAASYRAFFGESCEFVQRDVRELGSEDLPGIPTLVWASFPCQDLSLAGSGKGLRGKRSGTFRPFWGLVQTMIAEGRIPRIIVLENVVGTLTSHRGSDFQAIVQSLTQEKYRVGCLVIDAVRFLPQSRPRLFFVGVHQDFGIPPTLLSPQPSEPWHSLALRRAYSGLTAFAQDHWLWWKLPIPSGPIPAFTNIIDNEPSGVRWHTREETERLISLMSPIHQRKLQIAMRLGRRIVGTVYKRTRRDEDGLRVQRAEIRFDQISGCLRTPVGGSSRQLIVTVEGNKVRSRLLSAREAARLMGVSESYPLPPNYNDAYHLFGDGLAVPVVSWLSQNVLLPIASSGQVQEAA